MIRDIAERMVAANHLPTRISATTDRRQALAGARYIINCARVGGLEAFSDDIRIPLQYGVDQCVGDTICAGGIMYGQRSIAAILDFCRDIREVAEPGARLLNYANPMAMNTWAAIAYGGVDTIGLCHGIQHGAKQIAEVLGAEMKDLEYVCTGINHQTWYVELRLRGRRVGEDELLTAFERHPIYSQQEKVRIDVLRRFGVYSRNPTVTFPSISLGTASGPRKSSAGSTYPTGYMARPAAISAFAPKGATGSNRNSRRFWPMPARLSVSAAHERACKLHH